MKSASQIKAQAFRLLKLDNENRIGLCQQSTTIYQPQTLIGILTGGGKVIRPNNTSEFNNSKTNYVGALIMRLK